MNGGKRRHSRPGRPVVQVMKISMRRPPFRISLNVDPKIGVEGRIRQISVLAARALTRHAFFLFPSSRPRRVLFDHIPKCGGTTVSHFLARHYPGAKIFPLNNPNPVGSAGQFESVEHFKKLSRQERHAFHLVGGHLAHELLDWVHPDCLKVTLIREPVDRIISHYYYVRQNPAHWLHSKVRDQKISLVEYVTSDLSNELRNWCTTHFSGLSIAETERNPDYAVEKAVEVCLTRYDIIGSLDHFTSFIEKLRRQAKLRCGYTNEKFNVTRNRPNRDDIELSTIEKIEATNHLDIAFYARIKAATA